MHEPNPWGTLLSMHQTRIIRPARSNPAPQASGDQWTPGICTGYGVDMAPRADGKTPQRVIRVSDELWARFGAACDAIGTSRSDQLRVYMSGFADESERRQLQKSRATAAAAPKPTDA